MNSQKHDWRISRLGRAAGVTSEGGSEPLPPHLLVCYLREKKNTRGRRQPPSLLLGSGDPLIQTSGSPTHHIVLFIRQSYFCAWGLTFSAHHHDPNCIFNSNPNPNQHQGFQPAAFGSALAHPPSPRPHREGEEGVFKTSRLGATVAPPPSAPLPPSQEAFEKSPGADRSTHLIHQCGECLLELQEGATGSL